MLKLPVAFLLLVLALNASAHPWYHKIQRIGHVNLESTFLETHEFGDLSDSVTTQTPDEKPNEINYENNNDNENDIDEGNDDEDDNNESTDQSQDNEIDDDYDVYADDYDIDQEVSDEDDNDVAEPEPSDEEDNDVTEPEPSDSNESQQELFKYVFKTLKEEIMYDVFHENPDLRYKVQEIFDKYPVYDFSDGEHVEQAIQKILDDIKQLKKSNGIQTSSEERDSSSDEDTPVQIPDSDEGEDDANEIPNDSSEEDSESDEDYGSDYNSDEESDTDDSRKDLFKYVFKSLKEDLLNRAEPEIRDEIQEIFDKYPEPNYSNGDEVEELYQKILKDVKQLKKSNGIKTSSEEEDSSSNENGNTIGSSTSAPDLEHESNEVEVDAEASTEKPHQGQDSESDEDYGSDYDSDYESDTDDSRKDLYKHVFQSLKEDLLNSAEPEIRDEIQKIFDKYPEPDYSNGDEVEELYQKILKDVKQLKKSNGIKTSSEEEDSSSNENGNTIVSSTSAPDQEHESNEVEVDDEANTERPHQGQDSDSDEDSESNDDSDDDSGSDDSRKDLFKYVFQSLKEDLLNSAEPEIRDEIQKIFDKYPEPDYSNGDEVEELYQKILKDVKQLKESNGIKTSSEEEDSSSNESGDSVASSTAKPHQETTTTEKEVPFASSPMPSHESEEDSDEDRDKALHKYVFRSLKKSLLEAADPELRDEIKKIFDKYSEPDFSNGDEVEELYQKILKDVKQLKKSKGIKTSSEEDDSSYNEV